MIGIRLDKHKHETMDKIDSFLKPKHVYFKIDNNELLVKENDKVLMGDKIIKTKFDSFIHSSVSGKVTGIKEMIDSNNNKSKFIEIENDFKEKLSYKEQEIKDLSKDKFINILKENGIIGLGGAGFPTYIKYNNDSVKTLIVNAVECEPYITSDYYTCFNNIKQIIETLNIIDKIFNLEEIFIAIKIKNRNLKEKIIPYISNNKKIKLIEVPNLYPMGWEKSLVRYIKHTDYIKLPIEKSIVVSNVSTIYSIYEALKGKPLIEKIITVSGNFNNICNIKVKTGIKFSELKEIYKGYKLDDIVLITGGPMMGKSIGTDDFILENNVNCVIALPNIKEKDAITCLRCGKCADHCPAKITPVLVKDNINNKDELKRLGVERCIECGICSFVCPSKINLREYLREAKEKVK